MYLMWKVAENLFESQSEQQAFVDALLSGNSREKAILMLEDRPEFGAFPKERPQPWQPPFVLRVADSFRPAGHQLYEKGAMYSLDFSSVFAATPMLAVSERPERVLDLCSSPGGKAIFAWRAFRPEVLICNETMRKRTGSLIDNLARCHVESAWVGSTDPSVWANRVAESFDLVLVDAPCSGQSLLAKGEDASDAFDPPNIEMCVGRQRRIIGNAARCVRPGGYLLYMTCTFSIKENEKVIGWLTEHFPRFKPVAVTSMAAFASPFADFPCYRLFPQRGLGAGAFTCLLRSDGAMQERTSLPDELPCTWTYREGYRNRKTDGDAIEASPCDAEESAEDT